MTSFLRTWKVSTQLLALVAVFLVGFGAFGWLARITLEAVKVNGPKYEEIIRSKDLVADILPPPEYIIEAYLTVLQMENETDPARLQEREKQFQSLKSDYLKGHDEWAAKLPQGETRRVLLEDSYRPAVDFFQGVETRFLPALHRGDREAARKVSRGYLAQRYEAHRSAIDRVVKLANQEAEERKQEAGVLVDSRTNLLLGIGLLLVAAAIIPCILIARRIAAQLRKASSQITAISAEFAGMLAEDERMSTHQAVAVNETTTTMEELNASARLSAEQAEAASSGSREALSLADQGRATVSRTLDGITSLKERSSSIAEHILRLSDQTSQIGNITNLVSDLANQTNLLALNAAVEAARAGEHGRGFAVVASEIRKLADQSKKSAERISAILVEIQQATNSTVMATEEGTRTAQQGTQLAHSTGDAFNQLALSVGSAYESAQQIALNAKEQAAAVSQVVAAMNSLNAGAQEAANRSSQTRAGIERLNIAAGELAALV